MKVQNLHMKYISWKIFMHAILSVIFYSMSLFKFYYIYHENVTDLIHMDQWTVKNMTFERKERWRNLYFQLITFQVLCEGEIVIYIIITFFWNIITFTMLENIYRVILNVYKIVNITVEKEVKSKVIFLFPLSMINLYQTCSSAKKNY